MGGALHRLEVLLVGLVLLLAGVVVTALMLLRPSSATLMAVTPEPVAAVTAMPSLPTVPPLPTPPPAASPATALAAPVWLATATPVLRVVWGALLLASGGAGLGYLVAWRMRRRMAFTGQSVGMLLGAADGATRAANLRVMRDLFARGQLPHDLAVAAGIARRWRLPRLTLLPLRLPALRPIQFRVPQLRFSQLRLPALALPTLPRLQVSAPHAASRALTVPDALPKASTAEGGTAEESASDAGAWEAEDRALAVAAALSDIWRERGLTSPILALDARQIRGAGQVLVSIDILPDDDMPLADLPAMLAARRPGWSSHWQAARRGPATLRLDVAAVGERPNAGPPIVPVMAHGQGGRLVRFFPLATWRHLGVYGADATHALHALLTALLYTQPPDALALAICDAGQVSPLYRDIAHAVTPPGNIAETAGALAHALHGRQGTGYRRPLLLVAIEPDAAQLAALAALLQELRLCPDAPVHLIVVQEHVHAAGQELYALLPALITSGGSGPASLLTGQSDWPGRGRARLVARGMRVEGRARTLDEAAASGLLASLRTGPAPLPPVLWEMAASVATAEVGGNDVKETSAVVIEQTGASADWLRALLARDEAGTADGEEATAEVSRSEDELELAAPDEAPAADGWPAGPPPLSAGDLAALLARVLTSPAITSGQDDQRGLSKRRLADLLELPQQSARAVADVLMVWFDQAGVLDEPLKPGRLHHPRSLCETDGSAIAAKLLATPLPGEAEVRAAWSASAQEAGVR